MKNIILALLFVSCTTTQNNAPTWVKDVREGGKLKVRYGPETFYRRIAGTSSQTPDQACQRAIKKAEDDMWAEGLEEASYTVEVIYYDSEKRDCAVTLALRAAKKGGESAVSAARNIVRTRAQKAQQYAITGLTAYEFQKFTGEHVSYHRNPYSPNICMTHFRAAASYHAEVLVCWDNGQIVGYCVEGHCSSK